MNLTHFQVLQALGVMPLRLRARTASVGQVAPAAVAIPSKTASPQAITDKRIALARSQSEIEQPTLAALYTKITEAISALGLQCVRIADAEADPHVRVLAFGEVPLPATIAPERVSRVDALSTLNIDRVRKRALWELMQRLARESGGGDVVAVAANPLPLWRPMTRHDIAGVAAIEGRAYEFPWSPQIFRDCLAAGHKCWVLQAHEAIIGYGILSTGAEEAHILNVCVAPAQQGQGHGARILNRLLDLARMHRAQRVYLEVRPSNVHAHAMYERAGFNEIGRRPNYYPARRGREDAIVMAMELLSQDEM